MDIHIDFLKNKYNNSVILPVTGGGTNELYIVSRNGETKLVKIAGICSEDILNEYNALQLLSEKNETPKVYDLFYIGNRAGIEMEFIKGKNMLDILLGLNEKENIYLNFKRLGEILSRLHSRLHSRHLRNVNIVKKAAVFDADSFWEIDYVPRELLNEAVSVLKSVKLNDNELILTHGDFGYHNMLITEDGMIKVIDWEFAELNHPLNDIASVFFWTHLHFKEDAEERCKHFINAYTENMPIRNDELLMPFCVYKVLFIMRRTLNLHDYVKKNG